MPIPARRRYDSRDDIYYSLACAARVAPAATAARGAARAPGGVRILFFMNSGYLVDLYVLDLVCNVVNQQTDVARLSRTNPRASGVDESASVPRLSGSYGEYAMEYA